MNNDKIINYAKIINRVHHFIKYLASTKKKENLTLLLGLSGGPDSIFLFYDILPLVIQKEINLIIAHLDHGWRENSTQDANFCKNLSEKHTIPFHLEVASTFEENIKYNGSLEEKARIMRRIFFEEVAEKENADYILLGHHQQDQLETFFIRLIRGSSLQGLACMKEINGR